MASYNDVAFATWSNSGVYWVWAVCIVMILGHSNLSRFMAKRGHRNWAHWVLLPAYEIVFCFKLAGLIITTFIWQYTEYDKCAQGHIWFYYVWALFVWGYTVPLWFLSNDSAGTRSLMTSVGVMLLGAIIQGTVMAGEIRGFDGCPGLAWGQSFLSNSWTLHLAINRGSFIYGWDILFIVAYAGVTSFSILIGRSNATLDLSRRYSAYALFVLWTCQLLGEVYTTQFSEAVGFHTPLFNDLLQMPFIWLILLLDSRYWSDLSLDGLTSPRNMDVLEDPLNYQIAVELQKCHRAVSHEERAKNINFSTIRLGRKIAAGAAGQVWEATSSAETFCDEVFAVKGMLCREIDRNLVTEISREIRLSWVFSQDCKNIVTCYGFSIKPPSVYIVMQLCDRGSLRDVLTAKELNLRGRLELARQTAGAVAHLHIKGFLHCDLKSLNVMCASAQPNVDCSVRATAGESSESAEELMLRACLGDFGETVSLQEAEEQEDSEVQQVGTVPWMAPEIIENWKVTGKKKNEDGTLVKGSRYTMQADCFSLAVIIWECLSEGCPYIAVYHPKRNRLMLDVDRFMLGDLIVEGLRPGDTLHGEDMVKQTEITGVSKEMQSAMELGWDIDPQKRLSAGELVKALEREQTGCLVLQV